MIGYVRRRAGFPAALRGFLAVVGVYHPYLTTFNLGLTIAIAGNAVVRVLSLRAGAATRCVGSILFKGWRR